MKNPVQRWHVARGFAAISVLVATTACGPAVRTEADAYQEGLLQIRATYEGYFRQQPPDYVVITYPESPSSLPEYARDVFQTIRGVLTNRKIPHEIRKLDDVLTTFETRVRHRQYSAYQVPAALAADGATVLYINLCMSGKLETKRHPEAVRRDITVRIWDDPNTSTAAQRPVL